jgi:hypothetical protein
MTPEVVGLPDLGADRRADIVVDTHAMADEALGQIFTLTDAGLVRVAAPAFEDGNIVVYGGGVTTPQGTGCTADGSLVISMATAVDGGAAYQVTRQAYSVSGNPIRFGGPDVSSDRLPAEQLSPRFPEFAGNGFAPCGGAVDTGR